LSDEHIALAAKQCAGLDFIRPHPVTGDGHVWRCAIIFQAYVGKVLILLPMTCDNVEPGEMRLDRAPAAYTRDGANRRAGSCGLCMRSMTAWQLSDRLDQTGRVVSGRTVAAP
jgi:hypothetical protein